MAKPGIPPALGIIELASLARAAVVLDAIAKKAPVSIETAARVSPGKFLIVMLGGVAEVEESYHAGLSAADGVLVDSLFLPQAHRQLQVALLGRQVDSEIDSLGTFETYTASAAVSALDQALKSTDTSLVTLHLCVGIGGKGYWAVTGPLYAVQEAIEIADGVVPQEVRLTSEVIAAPHPEAVEALLGGE